LNLNKCFSKTKQQRGANEGGKCFLQIRGPRLSFQPHNLNEQIANVKGDTLKIQTFKAVTLKIRTTDQLPTHRLPTVASQMLA
ncbi:hypothetical protein ACQP3J_33950, partial [Escherichia coli]